MTAPPEKPGLQAERTLLSWERSSLGFLVAGAIPLFRHHGALRVGHAVVAVLAVVLALLVLSLARARARRIGATHVEAGGGTVAAPRTAVFVLGGATALLAAVIIAVTLLR